MKVSTAILLVAGTYLVVKVIDSIAEAHQRALFEREMEEEDGFCECCNGDDDEEDVNDRICYDTVDLHMMAHGSNVIMGAEG